jgi:hypothetical protein
MNPGYPPGYQPPMYTPPAPPRKNRTGLIIGIVVGAVLLVALCGGGAIFALAALTPTTSTAGTPGIETPTPAVTPTPAETVVYQNTFVSADGAPGWVQTAGECLSKIDGYHITSAYICYAPIGLQSDATIIVTAQQVSGPTTRLYGVVFRRVSTGNFYDFSIDSNGEWLFEKCVKNNCKALIDFTTNSAIKGGLHTSNRLKVVMKSSHFDFFVNDTKVGESDDATFASGKIGLEGDDSMDCAYTDLVITRPS